MQNFSNDPFNYKMPDIKNVTWLQPFLPLKVGRIYFLTLGDST